MGLKKHLIILSNNEKEHIVKENFPNSYFEGFITPSLVKKYNLENELEGSWEIFCILTEEEYHYIIDTIEDSTNRNTFGLFLLSQSERYSYDTYDSIVVSAPNRFVANSVHPYYNTQGMKAWDCPSDSWASKPSNVKVEEIGISNTREIKVICSSFNAG